MAEIVITLRDTPTGQVAVHTASTPPYQHPMTPAQLAAAEIVLRTKKQWGVLPQVPHTKGQ